MAKHIAQSAIERIIRKPKLFRSPAVALRTVTSKSGKGVYASSDNLFKGAVFGRDSLVVAEDLMTLRPLLVSRILQTLASFQGLKQRSANEEEPGKIIHEYRTKMVDGKPLEGVPLRIFNDLCARWGGSGTELIYYGSVDSTPLFITVLCKYCDIYGPTILERKIVLKDKSTATMYDVLANALKWLESKLDDSNSGLLEYHAHNVAGIKNQVWKDSKEFYVHENGRFVNHSRPVASIEAQSLAHDALVAAAAYFPGRAEELSAAACKLRDQTIKLTWQPRRDYFALGIDYTQEGELRIINTMTANPASLLNSGFFDGLSIESKRRYIDAIVRRSLAKTNTELKKTAPHVDIIHSMDFDLKNFSKYPNVTTIHGHIGFENLPFFQARKELAYVSISKNQQAAFPDLNYVGVVYNGLDPADFPIVSSPKKYLCFLGRFDWDKSPHLAIQLAISLGMRIKIAGKIDLGGAKYFKEQIQPYFSHPLVEFLGELSFPEKVALVSNAKCNLHPLLARREPFGLTVIESAYCGTPTLAMRRGSMSELIEDGRTGILVEDFVEGYHKVEKCFSMDRKYIAERARLKFNYVNMTRDYLKAYKKVLREFDKIKK